MMTAKARKLGMTGTIFRNANGLPNAAQHSTARDMATLGIALQRAFSAVLFLFLDPLVQIRQAAHGQPQPAARPRQGRRRHQDRLHPRFRLQPGLVGLGRQPPHRRRGHGRHQRRRPRPADGGADQEIPAQGIRPQRRRRPDGQGRRLAHPRARQRDPAEEAMRRSPRSPEAEAAVEAEVEDRRGEPEPAPSRRSVRPIRRRVARRAGLCRTEPGSHGRHRSGEHGFRRRAVRLGRPGRLVAERSRGEGVPRQDQRAGRRRSWPTPPATRWRSTRTA